MFNKKNIVRIDKDCAKVVFEVAAYHVSEAEIDAKRCDAEFKKAKKASKDTGDLEIKMAVARIKIDVLKHVGQLFNIDNFVVCKSKEEVRATMVSANCIKPVTRLFASLIKTADKIAKQEKVALKAEKGDALDLATDLLVAVTTLFTLKEFAKIFDVGQS